jgi:uncharacterized membrane protein
MMEDSMQITDISIIGWIHTIACIAALAFGPWNIVATKGTPHHKLRGSLYAASMVIAMGLSFFIYRFDIPLVRGEKTGPGVFGLFHWFAISALFFTLLGYYASSRQRKGFWAYTHPVAMTLSYYLLIGGLINELFARLNILRPFAFTLINGKLVFGTMVVGMTQFAAEIVTVILLIIFCVKVWRYRRNHSMATRLSAP